MTFNVKGHTWIEDSRRDYENPFSSPTFCLILTNKVPFGVHCRLSKPRPLAAVCYAQMLTLHASILKHFGVSVTLVQFRHNSHKVRLRKQGVNSGLHVASATPSSSNQRRWLCIAVTFNPLCILFSFSSLFLVKPSIFPSMLVVPFACLLLLVLFVATCHIFKAIVPNFFLQISYHWQEELLWKRAKSAEDQGRYKILKIPLS